MDADQQKKHNTESISGDDRRLKAFHQNHQPLKCPRCDSPDTKFCYYNNYNYSQPRHFCKACRRYWTIGGTLRNVPVGGRSRKSKKSKLKVASPSHSPILLAGNAVPSSRSDLAGDSELGVPFVFDWNCVRGTTPLKLSEGRGIAADPTAEKSGRGDGFGSSDLSSGGDQNEGMLEISSAVDEASWYKYCGFTTPFNN